MKKDKGFSLVELMVAIVVGLILVAGVIELFVNNRQMYRVQDNYARLQENGRYALNVLTDSIEKTGFSGCGSRSGLDLRNTLTASTELQRNYDFLISGNAYITNNWSPVLDDVIQNRQPIIDSDVLTTRNIETPDIRISNYANTDPISMNVNNTGGLDSGDFILAHNCELSAVFQLADDPLGGKLTTTANQTDLDYQFNSGARVNKIDTNTFFIRLNPNNQPSLYRFNSNQIYIDDDDGREEIIEGIESMKIQYGIDQFGSNGSADIYLNAGEVDSLNAWNQVLSVRVSLLLRSSEPNLTTAGHVFSDVATGDFADFNAPNDGRLRRIVTRTITLRNRVP